MIATYKKYSIAIIIFFFILLLINHIYGFTGYFGFDDLSYAELAHAFFQKHPYWDNPFTFRFGIVIPLGILYLLFGVSDFVSVLYPLSVSLGLLILVYNNLKGERYKILLATAILLSNPWIIFYSDKIGVDIPITFFIFLATTLIYKSRFSDYWQERPVYNGVLFAVVIFLGLLTKETIWFLFPLVMFFLLLDLWKKQRLKFWISATITISGLFFIYSLWQYLQFNNWFYRFMLIKSLDNTNICSYDRQPIEFVLNRISYELGLHFIRESAFILSILMTVLCINKNTFKNVRSKENFWLLSAVILILSANFWSISYHSYHPLCIDVRHYLYIMPVSAIAIAHHYKRLLKIWPAIILLSVSLLIVVFSDYLSIKEVAKLHAIFLSIVFVLMLIFRKYQKYIFLCLAFLPVINIYQQIKAENQFQYAKQKKVGMEFINDKDNITIYTAETQVRLFKYYLGFNFRNLKLIPYENFNYLADGYHYWNYHSAYAAGELDDIPPAVGNLSIPENSIYNSDVIKIWKLKNSSKLYKPALYNVKNSPLWSGFVGEIHHLKTDELYGPTFKIPVSRDVSRLTVSSRWEIKKKSSEDATLIFSLEEDGKSIIWKPFSIKSDRAVIDNWYTLYKSVIFENLDIKHKAELKVYIWNNFNTQLEIKDANVELIKNKKD